jgi:hypothetical protein
MRGDVTFALYWAIIGIETYRFYSAILSYCWTGQIFSGFVVLPYALLLDLPSNYCCTSTARWEVTWPFALYWAIISIQTYRFYSAILSYCWTGQIFSGFVLIPYALLWDLPSYYYCTARWNRPQRWRNYRTHYCWTCRVIIIVQPTVIIIRPSVTEVTWPFALYWAIIISI